MVDVWSAGGMEAPAGAKMLELFSGFDEHGDPVHVVKSEETWGAGSAASASARAMMELAQS